MAGLFSSSHHPLIIVLLRHGPSQMQPVESRASPPEPRQLLETSAVGTLNARAPDAIHASPPLPSLDGGGCLLHRRAAATTAALLQQRQSSARLAMDGGPAGLHVFP